MSEIYEGIVFVAPIQDARSVFSRLQSPLELRLLEITPGCVGLVRIADRDAPFAEDAISRLAAEISRSLSPTAALFYDSRSAYRRAVVFMEGKVELEYGESQELWVPLADDGEPMLDERPVPLNEWESGKEYDCLRSAIDLALAVVAPEGPTAEEVMQRFCYGQEV